MPNPENIIPPKKGEPSRNPLGRGKGNLNRATIARKWLTVKTDVSNPITGKKEKGTLEDQLMLSLIKEGLSSRPSKVSAIRDAFEMLYGKMTQPLDIDLTAIAQTTTSIEVIHSPIEDETTSNKLIQ